MVMIRIGHVPLLMLVSLMVAAPSASASDFTTGVIVGQMRSDDSGSNKVENTGLESKIKSNKWRKLDGPQGGYFVCPGEYRSYSERLRCRVHDDGLNGLMGGMTDAQELPLQQALTKMEGKPIFLQTIEVHGSTLAVKYQLAPPAQTDVKTQDSGVVKQEGEAQKVASQPPVSLSAPKTDSPKQNNSAQDTNSNTSAFQSPLDNVLNLIMNSNFITVIAIMMFLSFIAPDIMSIMRQSLNNRRDSEIDELLREARLAESERPDNEPPSVNELRERQQQNTERAPVVVPSAPAAKVQKEEPIEVQPGRRKIILD